MLFNSIDFAIFLPIVFAIYWFALSRNRKLQNAFLVIASYVFYGWWDQRFLTLIFLSTVEDFFVAKQIAKTDDNKKRRRWLSVSLIFNLGMLGFFKYFNFFIGSLSAAFGLLSGHGSSFNPLDIVLPVGISFYTFQGLSYVLDIYYKKTSPTKDVVSFFTFISFFPQLIAGPIERSRDLLPQFESEREFDYDTTRRSLVMIAVGLFKKMVIADRLAILVDSVYADPASHPGLPSVVAVLFFTFQLYLDFSAYSQIAVGTAGLFGFKLHDNFRRPYLSTTFKEFWKRWHITLTSWFMDYLYIPLGGNRKGKIKKYLNIMVVMLVSGLWHGADLSFVVWGGIHGLYQISLSGQQIFADRVLQ